MLVKSFLAWMEDAPVHERAEAVTMLATAYLAGTLGGEAPEAVEAALTLVLDDRSPIVRRALAMAFADRREAPRHIVLSLAADQSEVSALLVARSPLLTEADLTDLATRGDRLVLSAIALRQDVTLRIVRAVAGRGELSSACTLVANPHADIREAELLGLIETFGHHARFRETALRRDGLPGSARHALMRALAGSLGGFVQDGGFLKPVRNARLIEETVQQGTITIARRAGGQLADFVRYLRAKRQLTPALLLRSALGGDTTLIAAACADICGMDPVRVAGVLASRSEGAIAALVRRTGIPAFLEPVLVAVIRASSMQPKTACGEAFSLPVLHAAQAACAALSGDESLGLMALLRRFETETARAESLRMAEELRREVLSARVPHSLLPPDIGPEMLRLTMADDTRSEDAHAAVEAQQVEPARASSASRVMRQRGLLLDEPIPDLRSLITEWKAEHAARESLAVPQVAGNANRNEKPGRSRVA